MKIERLDLMAYGHLTDVKLDMSASPHQFHLIVGRNESGKSTSMRAINAWLFGFPGQTPDDYVHTMKKLRVGGIVSDGEETLHCIRRKGNRNTLLDGADGKTAIDDSRLQRMLGGIDAATFATQFAISHEELVSGGELILQGQGELGEMLFAAGAGLGKLKKVQEQLRQEHEAIFKRLGKSRIAESLKTIKRMKEELKTAQVPPAEYARLQAELSEKQTEIEGLKQNAEELSVRRAQLQAQIEALPIIPVWQQASQDLAEVVDTPVLSADFTEQRRSLAMSLSATVSNMQRIEKRLADLNDELDSVTEDKAIRDNRAEIESLIKQLPVLEKAEADRKGHMSNVLNSQERDLKANLADLARVTTQAIAESDDLTSRVHHYQLNEGERKKIVRLAGEYAKLVTVCEDSRRQVDRLQQRIASCSSELESLPEVDQAAELRPTLSQIGNPAAMVDNLRDAQSQVQRATARCEAIRGRLKLNASVEGIVSMGLPDPAVVDQTASRIDSIEDEIEIAKRRLAELKRQLADEEANYEAVETKTHLPSLAALDKARQIRDRRLAAIHEHVFVATKGSQSAIDDENEPGNFDSTMQAVRRADEIVDQLRMHQREVHQREAMVATIRKLTTKVRQAQSELDEQNALLESTQETWKLLWTEVGVTPGSPQAMRGWIDEHEKLVGLADVLADQVASLNQTEASVKDSADRLAKSLGDASDESGSGDDRLLRLHAQASLTVEQNDSATQQRQLTMQQIEGWKSELAEAERALGERESFLEQWHAQWDAGTASLGKRETEDASPAPEDVLAMLDSIKDLANLQKERDTLMHRMTSIENDTQAFLQSAARTITAVHDDEIRLRVDGDDTSVLLKQAAVLIEELNQRSKQEAINSARAAKAANRDRGG